MCDRGLVLILLVACCAVPALSFLCDGVGAPEKALSDLHPGCDDSRSSECVSAMHQFCNQLTFVGDEIPRDVQDSGMIGISTEQARDVVGVSCIPAPYYLEVDVNGLRRFFHSGCDSTDRSQDRDCLSAIHQRCMYYGKEYAGVSQEIPRSDTLGIRCFRSPLKVYVSRDDLRQADTGNHRCLNTLQYFFWEETNDNSASQDCLSAASRWCRSKGYDGGIPQELNGNYDILVACYNAVFTGDVYRSATPDFYSMKETHLQTCHLTNQLSYKLNGLGAIYSINDSRG